MNEEEIKTVASSGGTPSPEERPDKLQVGYLIDNRYRVVSVIGEGGNGVVYRVHQIFLNKDMALKTIIRRRNNSLITKRFRQEARAASTLDHPNLIKVLDFGVLKNDQPFLVMELIDGVSFAHYLRKRGAITPEELLPMFISVCEGLAYAHDRGVIHRDIKPGNIMILNSDRTVKIVDFGIAKITHDEGEIQALTRTGEIFGSPLYMSPEQCLGIKTDNRADIYSLGCVMYEALTGTPPFIAETALQTMLKHTTEMPPPLSTVSMGRQFPQALEEIIFKMLSKSPEDRYSHALGIAHELRAIDPEQALVAPLPSLSASTPQDRREKEKRRNLVTPLLSLLSLVSGIGLGLVFAGSHGLAGENKEEIKPLVEEEPISFSLKHMSKPLAFPPVSCVYELPNGKKMRRFHIPEELGEVRSMKTGRPYRMSYFDLPADDPIDILVRANVPLSGNVFDGLDQGAVGRLQLMKIMNLEEATLQSIAHLKSLVILNLDYSPITGKEIELLNALPRLRVLSVQGTDLSLEDLARLKRLGNLTTLNVANLKRGRRLLEILAKTNTLQVFGASNIDVSDDDLAVAGKISSLDSLTLMNCPYVTDRGLKHLLSLSHLESLDLRNSTITADSADTISRLPALTYVAVTVNGWTREQAVEFMKRVRKRHPRCSIQLFRRIKQVEQEVDIRSFDADLEKETVETIDAFINNK